MQIDYRPKIAEHFAETQARMIEQVNLGEMLSYPNDIPGVIENHTEWHESLMDLEI